MLLSSGTLCQWEREWNSAKAHLSWGGLVLALACALLEGRARETADNGVHALGAGVLLGG